MALSGYAIVAVLGVLVATTAGAAELQVDRTDDAPAASACDAAAPNDCSLRGAVAAANALAEASTIRLPAGTYVLSATSSCTFRVVTSSPGTFTSSQIALCLSKQITIDGAGAAITVIDANQTGRALFVSADAVAELRGVTLRNGNGGPAFFASNGGGGIQSHGTLTLTESVVRDNTLPTSASTGAGILNFGVLTLRRSVVTNNVAVIGAEAGGGIHNEGFYSDGIVNVLESTISANRAGSRGGGISNGATLTIVDSTISGNTALNGIGGGIANLHAGGNFVARLTAVNSTISGNQSGTQGGGLSASTLTTVRLNNVTITDNTAGTSAAASRSGGGINNSGSTQFTLQNTLIAGNRDTGLVPAPDCFAEAGNGVPVISAGHNLVEDASHCTFTGDTTGNLTGIDPALGALLDHGGPTSTHALGAGSAALDAGNPAAPGSGGAACAAIDQRGVNRLQDGTADDVRRCDIGAFELATGAVGFGLSGIEPSTGGNPGTVVALVYGSGFLSGATVKLARAGQADIVGEGATVTEHGALLTARFDLGGKALGPWDVVVTNPDSAAVTESQAFTITSGGGADLWADVIGPSQVRVGRPARFTVLFGNRGTVDAEAVPLLVTIPAGIALEPRFAIAPPPSHPSQVATDWTQVPAPFVIDDLRYLPLVVPVVPAGFTLALEVTVTPPPASLGTPFQIRAEIEASQLDATGLGVLVDGARSYAQRVLGVDLPTSLDAQLRQYAADQLQALVAHGSATLVTSGATRTDVYGSRQLVVDLAQFGETVVMAGRATSTTLALGAPRGEWSDRCLGALAWLLQPSDAHAADTASCAEIGRAYDARTRECRCDIGSGRCGPGGGTKPSPIGSADPNDKAGAAGFGAAHFVPADQPLRYTVRFENVETATAPALDVVITDELDPNLVDFATFSLGPMSFGATIVVPPPGLRQYTTSVDLRPENDLLVGIDAGLDELTGIVTWRFTSIDPRTGQVPEDPLAGFLPPNDDPPEGDGAVVFTIEPRVSNQPICNDASIVFDVNDPIVTPAWCNTIDATVPASQVAALAATQAAPTFAVAWSGSDPDAGIAGYDVFVSENEGPFTAFVVGTTDTTAMFTGQVGKSYGFYSVARDLAGNVEAVPAAADTTTIVSGGATHDLALTKLVVPKKVGLSTKAPAKTVKVKVEVQNRSAHPETIPDLATLAALVKLEGTSLGGCLAPVPVLAHKKKLPAVLKTKAKLAVVFTVGFDCANDPAKTTAKDPGHDDYTWTARVRHAALDGNADTHPADDGCPRSVTPPAEIDPNPNGKIKDKGCGAKKPDATFGAPVVTDVAVKP
jgi:hypothetical protein